LGARIGSDAGIISGGGIDSGAGISSDAGVGSSAVIGVDAGICTNDGPGGSKVYFKFPPENTAITMVTAAANIFLCIFYLVF
jgi:hypothetical protein